MSTQGHLNRFDLDVWHDPNELQWVSRDLAHQARQAIVQEAFSEYISVRDTTLEIGSGTGALQGLAGRTGNFVHVDGSLAMLNAHKSKGGVSSGSFTQADLYRLPFSDDSVDSVAGLLVLDAIVDPPAAMEEIGRILKPGGAFLYFHDMIASTNGLAKVIRSSGDIPVPLTETGDGVESIGMLNPKELGNFEKALRKIGGRRAARAMISVLTEDAPLHFDYWKYEQMETVRGISPVFRETFGEDHETPHVSETFMQLMADMAGEVGMDVKELGFRSEDFIMPQETVEAALNIKLDTNTNLVAHTIVGDRYGYNPDIKVGNVSLVSEIAIIAAIKK